MSLDSRLARLAPGFTAQERAILVLEAWKDERPEDPAWRNSMPQEQTATFNQYIDLMNRVNNVLGRLISRLHQQAEKLEVRWECLLSLVVWQDHVDEIRQAVIKEVKQPATRRKLDAVLHWTPEVDGSSVPPMPSSLIDSMKSLMAYELISTWVEAGCIEIVVQDIGAEFKGADPLRPVFREKLTFTREKLLAIKERLLALSMDVELRDPLDEELQEMRDWFASLPEKT